MLFLVESPNKLSGLLKSNFGKLEVNEFKLLYLNENPGLMAPPKYSPNSLTKSKVIQVPKSTTRQLLCGYSITADPIRLILSGPNVFGVL